MYYLYLIKNTINKRCYVGVTGNPAERFKQHKDGHKSNIRLQNAFLKYGEHNFIFETVCYGTKEEILLLEELVVDIESDYNIVIGGGLPPSWKGRKHTEEFKKSISIKRLGKGNPMYGKKLSREHSEKISKAIRGEKHYMWGKPISEEARVRLALLRKGIKHTEETRKKMSESRKGIKFSKERCERISLRQIGRKYSQETIEKMRLAKLAKSIPIICKNDEKVYPSISQAATYYNLNSSRIVNVLNGKYKQHKGYVFVYA